MNREAVNMAPGGTLDENIEWFETRRADIAREAGDHDVVLVANGEVHFFESTIEALRFGRANFLPGFLVRPLFDGAPQLVASNFLCVD